MPLWIAIALIILCFVTGIRELVPERCLPRLLRRLFAGAAVILALYAAWEIKREQASRVYAEISSEGVVLRDRNFPWPIEQSRDVHGNTVFTLIGKQGDLSLLSVKVDRGLAPEIIQSWAGTSLVFPATTSGVPERFVIEVGR